METCPDCKQTVAPIRCEAHPDCPKCPVCGYCDVCATEENCPHCDGSKIEPGTEEPGDWDSAAMRHHPYTGEPCIVCKGHGKAATLIPDNA